jgi:hypothetical protein
MKVVISPIGNSPTPISGPVQRVCISAVQPHISSPRGTNNDPGIRMGNRNSGMPIPSVLVDERWK